MQSRRKSLFHSLVMAAAVVICAVVTIIPATAQQTESSLEGVPRLGHVFLIIGENTTYDHLNSTNAPYLMNTVRPARPG